MVSKAEQKLEYRKPYPPDHVPRVRALFATCSLCSIRYQVVGTSRCPLCGSTSVAPTFSPRLDEIRQRSTGDHAFPERVFVVAGIVVGLLSLLAGALLVYGVFSGQITLSQVPGLILRGNTCRG